MNYKELDLSLFPKKPCVYFLLDEDEIVYIGKSDNNIMRRICSHLNDKTFSSVRYYEFEDKTKTYRMEQALIAYYNPKYNGRVCPIWDTQQLLNSFFNTKDVEYKITLGSERYRKMMERLNDPIRKKRLDMLSDIREKRYFETYIKPKYSI